MPGKRFVSCASAYALRASADKSASLSTVALAKVDVHVFKHTLRADSREQLFSAQLDEFIL
jgi:hypothetical protein